jgi:integrase
MTGLSERVEEYLRLRRALGFKLERAGRLLDDFVAFADQAGERTVTVEVAVAWATRSPKASPVWVVQQLGMVRTFARWLQTLEPVTEVPPVDLLSAPVRRATPYVYSEAEIAALMTAARSLTDPLRAATFETLIGLLATTGLRVGEAMRLDRRDIDWTQRLLFVNNTKFGKSRQLPLHASTLDALADYANRRDQLLPSPVTASFSAAFSTEPA